MKNTSLSGFITLARTRRSRQRGGLVLKYAGMKTSPAFWADIYSRKDEPILGDAPNEQDAIKRGMKHGLRLKKDKNFNKKVKGT